MYLKVKQIYNSLLTFKLSTSSLFFNTIRSYFVWNKIVIKINTLFWLKWWIPVQTQFWAPNFQNESHDVKNTTNWCWFICLLNIVPSENELDFSKGPCVWPLTSPKLTHTHTHIPWVRTVLYRQSMDSMLAPLTWGSSSHWLGCYDTCQPVSITTKRMGKYLGWSKNRFSISPLGMRGGQLGKQICQQSGTWGAVLASAMFLMLILSPGTTQTLDIIKALVCKCLPKWLFQKWHNHCWEG